MHRLHGIVAEMAVVQARMTCMLSKVLAAAGIY